MTKLVSPLPEKKHILRICEKKYPYEYLAKGSLSEQTEQLYQTAEAFYREIREE